MKLYFVRHGQSESNVLGTTTGWMDSPLTDEGIKQAEETAFSMHTDFTKMYSSDLIRCKQTAEVLNKKLNLKIVYDKRLRERNFGSLQGKTWEWMRKELDKDMRMIDREQKYDYRSYGGESVDDAKERLFDFINEIKSKYKGEKILVVTHAGIIRLLHNVLNDKVHKHIENSSIHEFEF